MGGQAAGAYADRSAIGCRPPRHTGTGAPRAATAAAGACGTARIHRDASQRSQSTFTLGFLWPRWAHLPELAIDADARVRTRLRSRPRVDAPAPDGPFGGVLASGSRRSSRIPLCPRLAPSSRTVSPIACLADLSRRSAKREGGSAKREGGRLGHTALSHRRTGVSRFVCVVPPPTLLKAEANPDDSCG